METASGRRAANKPDQDVNVRSKAASKLSRAGTTQIKVVQNKSVSNRGRAANAPIKIVSKLSRAVKIQSRAASKPNHGGKVAGNGVDEVAEVVAINGTNKVKAIVGEAAVVVGSRVEIAAGSVNGNPNAKIDRCPRRAKIPLSQRRRTNHSKSRRPLACGTRYLDRLPSKRPKLSTSRSMKSDRHRTCEMTRDRPAAGFPMRTLTIRCRCSTNRTKEIVPANRRLLPRKRIGRIDHGVGRVDAAGVAAADESRRIVHQRVEQRGERRGSVVTSRASKDRSRNSRTNSLTRS